MLKIVEEANTWITGHDTVISVPIGYSMHDESDVLVTANSPPSEAPKSLYVTDETKMGPLLGSYKDGMGTEAVTSQLRSQQSVGVEFNCGV